MEQRVEFFSEDVDFELTEPEAVANWIASTVEQNGQELEQLTFIFCSDAYLHQMNVEYLDHDTLTDIITFNNADTSGIIEGDIFISVDRVEDNAKSLDQPFYDELHRVIIHGVLHLLGYDDKSEELKAEMRRQEDKALSLRNF